MELGRYIVFFYAFCVVVYAAETTIDLTSTTVLAGGGGTGVTEQLTATTPRTDRDNAPLTDTPLDNEIKDEEQVTSAAIKNTEEFPQVKELPTTKLESTTVEAKEVVDHDTTTATPPPPPQATERSSLTTKEKQAIDTVATPLPVVTVTPSTVSLRQTKPNHKKNKTRPKPIITTTAPATTTTTTTVSPRAEETMTEERPVATNTPQKLMTNPLYRPDRKSTVEVKKGTINAGALQHTKRRKPSKKDNGMSSLLYIPLMIQAQMIPMMLIQLKFFALKALAIGKLALIILGLNLLRNAIVGYNNDEQQYEQESLASAHYGYNGGPEYGSWVNRRMFQAHPELENHKQISEMEPMTNTENTYTNIKSRLNRSQSRFSNNPYRGYASQILVKTR